MSDIYSTVTDKIVAKLEQAQAWQRPWTSALGATPGNLLARPVNAVTGKRYRGINVPLLWCADFASPQWATYKAWQGAGAQVRKGEKCTHIIFWKRVERRPVDGQAPDDAGHYLMARGYAVFNAEQVDGWTAPAPIAAPAPVLPVDPVAPIAAADTFVARTGAIIRHAGSRAFYAPSVDSIQIPPREQFIGTTTSSASDAYYGTLFHELTHWTGAEKRCNRQFGKRFGDDAYAAEELVAELGAAFLCADHCQIYEPRADHADYLASWLKILKADKRAIFTAASKAEQAVSFLAGLQSAEEEEAPDEALAA